MSVLHYLFWIKNNTVASLRYTNDGLQISKNRGKKYVPLTDAFWSEWVGYAGMCRGDKTDFCLIYDERPSVDERLLSEQCKKNNCIWSRAKIEAAVELLNIIEPTEIRNENGILLAKAGCFMNARKEDIISMTAWYQKADKDGVVDNVATEVDTAFKKYYKSKLQEYKKGYET